MSISNLLGELNERTIAKRVAIPHDEARMSYPLYSNTVRNFDEFTRIIGDYYSAHSRKCISRGGNLHMSDAASRAKEIIEQEYRRRNGDIVTAFNDAHDGTNGGMRSILDIISEGLKTVSVERYIRDAFDRYVAPNSWNHKVTIIKQFIDHCGVHLASAIHRDQPERYAQNYQELIRSYINALQTTSSIFRRL